LPFWWSFGALLIRYLNSYCKDAYQFLHLADKMKLFCAIHNAGSRKVGSKIEISDFHFSMEYEYASVHLIYFVDVLSLSF